MEVGGGDPAVLASAIGALAALGIESGPRMDLFTAITAGLAAQAVAVAVASNIVAKAAYGVTLGSGRFGRIFGLGSAAGLAAGAAALLATAG